MEMMETAENERSKAALQISRWATTSPDGTLLLRPGPMPITMQNSQGTGMPLLKEGDFGADLIRFSPGEGVRNHTHEGSHVLFVVKGEGWVDFERREYVLEAGLCYLIPSLCEHAIRAKTELVLIAVGTKHRELQSVERMTPVEH